MDETGKRWAHYAREAGWGLECQIQVVADGAERFRRQAGRVCGDPHHLLCDFYQASESLAAAAKSIQCAQNERWRHTQQRRLKRGAAGRVIAALAAHGEPPDPPKEDAPVTNAHRDMNHRRDCVDYKSALAQDLPIGSGLSASGHRHVLQARLKKAGTSSRPETAEALAQLRVLRANHQWHTLWN